MRKKNVLFIVVLAIGVAKGQAEESIFYQNDSLLNVTDTLVYKDTVKAVMVEKDTLIPIVKDAELAYDTIFKKSGFAVLCKVLDKNLYEIKYIKKGEKLERKISTRDLKSVSYADGRVDIIDNNPQKTKKDWVTTTSEVEWRRIKHFYNANEVAGMVEKGELEAEYVAAKVTMGNDVLERNAIAILQKKASNLKANAILILSKDIKREYGEIPSIRMTAKAYSKE